MRADPDQPDPLYLGMEIGVVVNRADPAGLGRVRVRIPGLIPNPGSAWAFPVGAPGGGSADRGTWWIPEEGAEVAVWFKRGDPDHPYYMPANWGAPTSGNEVPSAAQVAGKGDPAIRVYAFGAYDMIIDTRPASKKFRIVDRSDGENLLEFDGVTRVLTISATTAIRINATGTIDIQALVVTIQGIVAGTGNV